MPLPVALLPDAKPSLCFVVTGATSQLGRALLPMLHAQGQQVIALSRDAHVGDDASVQWHRADLAQGWPDVAGCDVGISFGPMQALAEALSALPAAPFAQLVATSSMSAESKRDSLIAEDRDLSASLRNAEAALIEQCERLGIAWTILRPTMIYGLGLDENLSPIAHRALQTRVFPYPKGSGLRQPVHAEDVALTAFRAVSTTSAQGRILEIGGGERLRVDDMFRRVCKGMPVWALPVPVPQGIQRLIAWLKPGLRGALSRVDQDLIADNTALETLLGVKPRGFTPDVARWLEARS